MLIGGSKHLVDAKGRVFFPTRFREDMWEEIIACRGVEKCLMLFSPEEWQSFSDRIKAQNFSRSSQLQRFFFSTAAVCSVDSQGRLLLPQQLREFAGINKEVWIVGTQNRAEVWDLDEWNSEQLATTNESVKSLMDEIGF